MIPERARAAPGARARRIAVLGAGSWGMTLGILLHGKGHRVTLWDANAEFARALDAKRENERALPGVRLPAAVRCHEDPRAALRGAECVVMATPTQGIREACATLRGADLRSVLLVNVSKGLEAGSGLRPSQILRAALPKPPRAMATLAGPSHAEEVARRVPTAVVAASTDRRASAETARTFETPSFRVFTSRDPDGVELCGALKNVVAIAAGILDGLGLGDNTKAALVTRGQAEIATLGAAMGTRPETYWGLAGIGDLIVTCMSRHSRNRYVGEEIARGRNRAEVVGGMVMVAEGVHTCRAAVALAAAHGVEMPICEQVHAVLFQDKPARRALEDLLARPIGAETAVFARRRSGRRAHPSAAFPRTRGLARLRHPQEGPR